MVETIMYRVLRSGFFWRFVGGFALGAVGLATLHPATATTVAASQPVRSGHS